MVKPLGIIEVDGYRMGFEQAGQGPPVVLVQGYLCDGRSTWRPQPEGLRDEFTMVAWDVPGAGASSDPPEDLGIRLGRLPGELSSGLSGSSASLVLSYVS